MHDEEIPSLCTEDIYNEVDLTLGQLTGNIINIDTGMFQDCLKQMASHKCKTELLYPTSFIQASPYSVVFPTNMELPRRMFSSDVNTLVSAGVSVDEETNTLVLSNRMYLPLLPLLSRQVP